MQLQDWMDVCGKDDEAMASLVRSAGTPCDRSTINRLRRGKVWLSKDLAATIKAVTKGAVTADDFLDEARCA